MLTKTEHKTNRTSVKLAVLLAAGLIGGALIPSGAWAAKPTPIGLQCTDKGKSAFDTKNVLLFEVDGTTHTNVYYGKKPTIENWNNPKTIDLNHSYGISISISNPTYCYKVSGSKICVTY